MNMNSEVRTIKKTTPYANPKNLHNFIYNGSDLIAQEMALTHGAMRSFVGNTCEERDIFQGEKITFFE